MKISGFTFSKNAEKLYFPIAASIESVLPMVDEFVVALGDCDADDKTREEILAIGSEKIRIIDTLWDLESYPNNTVYAQQTDLAKAHCSGDWLIYIQNDEVIHQEDIKKIKEACLANLGNRDVDGFIFKYLHFWGDYEHYHKAHNWYPYEIRIIRKSDSIHSWRDAQSFRKFDEFDGKYECYTKKPGTSKLKVLDIGAKIYHYGWVRPPKVMASKAKIGNPWLAMGHFGKNRSGALPLSFDYGPMNRLYIFSGSHPQYMQKIIGSFNWGNQLSLTGRRKMNRPLYKHEKLWYRFLSWLENNLLGGKRLGGFKNYKLVKSKDLGDLADTV
ncbi:MAG: hypothetical protein O2887_06300 [Bacteroidetes bacterium]|nr:hypothetical protein [Bacteroidota bacterium]MDA1120093.1 hypothetical protein [Bacteroidota bacterium]